MRINFVKFLTMKAEGVGNFSYKALQPLRKINFKLILGIIVEGILAFVTAGILIGTEVTRVNGWISSWLISVIILVVGKSKYTTR